MSEATGGPLVGDAHIDFFVEDNERLFARIRLAQELARPRLGPEFIRFANADKWQLSFPRPDADRMEYQIEVTDEHGNASLICDPNNPLRAPGPFGDKSVIEFPGYEPPTWLTHTSVKGNIRETEIPLRGRKRIRCVLWQSEGTEPDEALPLLVAHDGPEYAEYSGLLHYLDQNQDLPPMRAALLTPYDRDQTYSASAAYARQLVHEVLPALVKIAPMPHGRRMRVGMGASLGALAMLYAHRTNPASFGGLFLQSGSFFRMRFDKHESGFARFRRISRFVGQVLAADEWMHPIRATMTCGTVEENLTNNRAVLGALEKQGYDIELIENRDGHNWVGWRDTFDPHLGKLLKDLWT